MTDNTAERAPGVFQHGAGTDRSAWASTWLSVAGALAMTSCCILPLVLVSLGVTGVFLGQLGALYQYKWITFSISAAFLGYGFWKAYRPVPAKACDEGACTRPVNRRVMRSILWAAAAIIAVAMVFPYTLPLFLTF
ncbi:MAG: mercuric transporter MerT family protein [Paracoccaceae bacterium]